MQQREQMGGVGVEQKDEDEAERTGDQKFEWTPLFFEAASDHTHYCVPHGRSDSLQ